MDIIKLIFALFVSFLACYLAVWAVLGAIFGAVLSLGKPQRIIFIDKQLAKDVDKLHSNSQCMMSYEISTRFMMYCFKYPFIRHRVKTDSFKFRLFMWGNCIGFWGFISIPFIALFIKLWET
jgi:hypothetical protein